MSDKRAVGRPSSNGIGASRPPTTIDIPDPLPRGRPRATGTLRCGRCHRDVPRIRVRWPDGAICGICFTQALHNYGICSKCGDHRLLPGRSPVGEDLCRDCAGITTEMTCNQCGREAERFRAGACVRCVIRADLTVILQPDSPPDARLTRLVDILAEVARPESIYTWMRGAQVRALLESIGERRLELSHQAFDRLPSTATAANHLREILVHHRLLPERDPLPIARFKSWLDERLVALVPFPEIHRTIEQFARWHHLRRLTGKSSEGKDAYTATHAAKQEITEATKFLIWLRETSATPVSAIQQAQIDIYLSEGTSTRKHIRNFVRWLNRTRLSAERLDAPHRPAKSMPLLTQAHRLQLVRNCLEFDQTMVSTRVAALIFLLWAHPLHNIVSLKLDSIQRRATEMRITLGTDPAVIPDAIAPLFWQLLAERENQRTANIGTDWLFPGGRAGQHIRADSLTSRFKALGIDPQRARNTTLQDLVHQLDARSLSDLLGYSAPVIALHAARADSPMSDYVDLKRGRGDHD